MAISRIEPAGLPPAPPEPRSSSAAKPAEGPFATVINRLLATANTNQAQADQAVRELAMGRTDDLHNVMLAVAQADLTFRLVLEIRNRLVEGFQEVLRLQV